MKVKDIENMNTTHILLINVLTKSRARRICESIENDELTMEQLKQYLTEEGVKDNHWKIYDLSDFMDLVNNQELDNLSEYFISYVHIKNKKKK